MLLVESMIGIAADLTRIQTPANEDFPVRRLEEGSVVALYYELRGQITQNRDAGNLPKALHLCETALALAEQTGDRSLIDQAYCNWSGFALVLGRTDVSASQLREILMRNQSIRTSFTAAYNLSYIYSSKKNYKKALFYAQIAQHRAYALGETEPMVQSHNEIGRSYLSESYFDKAAAEYEKALGLLPEQLSYWHIAPMGNMGYTKLLCRDYHAGMSLLYRILRHCAAQSSEQAYQEWIHLYLCFGHLELGRWRYAWHHGRRSLLLAEQTGDVDVIKNSLYLLGELEKSVGDMEAAEEYFTRLQHDFYPDIKDLTRLLFCCETRELINLRA